jgi:hypothetical protein
MGFVAGEDGTAEGCPRSFSSNYMELYLFYLFLFRKRIPFIQMDL